MQQNPTRKLTALLCQNSPRLAQKQHNLAQAALLTQHYTAASGLDLILFPEMSFTGYNFQDPAAALPLAVPCNHGPEFAFARQLALRTNAYVCFGYIELVEDALKRELFNSAAVLDRAGNLVLNYRKSYLYVCDWLWASQGNCLSHFQLVNTRGEVLRCGVGICKDILGKVNVGEEQRLADYCRIKEVDVLLFLTNWVEDAVFEVTQADVQVAYDKWENSLSPIISAGRPFLFLAADRVGSEYDFVNKREFPFYGSSGAIQYNPKRVLGQLDILSEDTLLVETFL